MIRPLVTKTLRYNFHLNNRKWTRSKTVCCRLETASSNLLSSDNKTKWYLRCILTSLLYNCRADATTLETFYLILSFKTLLLTWAVTKFPIKVGWSRNSTNHIITFSRKILEKALLKHHSSLRITTHLDSNITLFMFLRRLVKRHQAILNLRISK